MAKKIAVIGSSGGNLYSQGGSNPEKLLGEIFTQAKAAGLEIGAIQFIAAGSSMDTIKQTSMAKLYILEEGVPAVVLEDQLAAVNEKASVYDFEIAAQIESGEIEAVFMMSSDPDNTNRQVIVAAAEKKIPVCGTGGTSIAKSQALGARVISASGTTGTTNRTRAVAFVSALAKEWKIKYSPVIGAADGGKVDLSGNVLKRFSFRGIMMGALPGFISMALVLALSKIPLLSGLDPLFMILINALPVLVAVMAAKQISGLDEVGIVAGVVAGVMSVNGGVLGGIIGGFLAGVFAYYLIKLCMRFNFPGTTANIVAGGISGLVAGIIVYFVFAPVALWAGDGVRWLLEQAISFNPILAGALAGLIIWPALMGGVYHAAILPIVMLELEATGMSFLGSIDMMSLVMVSAGITLANIVYPRRRSEAAVAAPGFAINIFFGTFVEAAYPFMFSDKLVFASALIAGTLGGAAVGAFNVRGTAYVTTFAAPFLSSDAFGFAVCQIFTMAVAFVLAVICNKIARNRGAAAIKE